MSQMDMPPTEPGDIDEQLLAEPPVWPKVVGIISIVWGALGATCTGLSTIATPLMSGFMSSAAQGGPLPPTMQLGPLDYALAGARVALSVLLLVAGIATVSRRPNGRALHLIYGFLAFPVIVAAVAQGFMKNQQMAQFVQDHPDSPFAQGLAQGRNDLLTYITLGVYVLIALIWPIFCLIWFGLVKRRTEDMTGTAPPPAA